MQWPQCFLRMGRTLLLVDVTFRHVADEFLLLRVEHRLEALRGEDLLALLGSHPMQLAEGAANRIATVLRKPLKLIVEIEQALPLLRRQLLEPLHSVEHLFALIRRKLVEPAKTLNELLLALRRKLFELWFLFQHLFLLFRREIVVLAEPLSRLMVVLTLPLFGVVLSVALVIRAILRVCGGQRRRSNEDEDGGCSLHLQFVTRIDAHVSGVKVIQQF